MSKKARYLLGIILTIIIGTYFFWKHGCEFECCNGTAGADSEKVRATDDTNLNAQESSNNGNALGNKFSLIDANGDFSFENADNFNFNTSDYALITPISAALNGGIDQLSAYLEGNPNKNVTITGLYTSQEDNNSAYPNLGLARANAVKNYFTSRGISSKMFNTRGLLNDDLSLSDNIYKGPVNFEMNTATDDSAKKDAEDMMALKESIMANPLVIYFDTAAASINLSPEQRTKIANLSMYLDKNPDARIKITGHTDNTGSATTNMRLGQERADFAKQYFIKNGISEAKIVSTSQGPNKPIATNATEEGRSKNRRTEVTLN